MQRTDFSYLWHIIKQLLVVMLLFTITRIIFYGCNNELYDHLTFKMLWGGMRFDLSMVIILNGLFILTGLLPFKFRLASWYFKTYRILFVVFNGFALALNLIDVAYVPFTQKRSGIDLFTTQGLGTDALHLAPQFAKDYWYLILVLVGMLIVLYKAIKPFKKTQPINWIKQVVLLVLALGFSVLGQRGGLQVKPLILLHANEYASSNNTALVLNTPFTILQTFGSIQLKPFEYFSDQEVSDLFSPKKQGYVTSQEKLKPNVCLIILESFSQENIGGLSGNKTYTPFLDSLIKHALVFPNTYANGLRSIAALPSLLASFPTLMEQPYITSPYGTNQIKGLGSCLKEMNYSTSFYHGGQNGTMGFDLFSKQAGFDAYYGRKEYVGKPEDDDNRWGIFDEPFLQYVSKQLTATKEPFASVVFTLSSHHPFIIPTQHQGKFVGGENELQNSIQYSDYALKQFFKTAKKEPWFDRTVFIITADHTSLSADTYYNMHAGTFRIPLIFYAPAIIEPEKNEALTQHLDVMPTILDLAGYPSPFYAFGESVFNIQKETVVINRKSNMWQIQNDTLLLRFDGQNTQELYDLKTDSICYLNILDQTPKTYYVHLENQLKAQLQQHNSDLINNNLTVHEKP